MPPSPLILVSISVITISLMLVIVSKLIGVLNYEKQAKIYVLENFLIE